MHDILFNGNPITIKGNLTKEGQKAKNFVALKQDLKPFNFFEETKGKIKIISIAPSLDTGVCAFQAEEFHKKIESYKDKVTLVSITVDLPFAQKRFCDSNDIENGIIVSDHKEVDFGKKYGFLIDELRLLTRGVIIVDEDNIVRYVEYVDEVTNHVHYEKAFKKLKDVL